MIASHFLSEEACREARRILAQPTRPRSGSQIDRHLNILSESATSSFDETYLAILDLALTGRSSFRRPERRRDRSCKYSATFMLDIEIQIDAKAAEKDELPLDEFAINRIVNFISGVRSILPYRIELEEIRLGCVFLEFGMALKLPRPGDDRQGPVFGKVDTSLNFGESFFRGPLWESLKERSKVVDFDIAPTPG